MNPAEVRRQLSNPNSPVVKRALTKPCPDCLVHPGAWCVGIAENSPTKGRPRKRIHFARCEFAPGDATKAEGTGRRAERAR